MPHAHPPPSNPSHAQLASPSAALLLVCLALCAAPALASPTPALQNARTQLRIARSNAVQAAAHHHTQASNPNAAVAVLILHLRTTPDARADRGLLHTLADLLAHTHLSNPDRAVALIDRASATTALAHSARLRFTHALLKLGAFDSAAQAAHTLSAHPQATPATRTLAHAARLNALRSTASAATDAQHRTHLDMLRAAATLPASHTARTRAAEASLALFRDHADVLHGGCDARLWEAAMRRAHISARAHIQTLPNHPTTAAAHAHLARIEARAKRAKLALPAPPPFL